MLVDDPAFSEWLAKRTPAARWGRVEELVGAAVFLSSDAPARRIDRWPWLDRVGGVLAEGGIVSCSALKRGYRDRLRQGAGRPVAFVFLRGSQAVLTNRMARRTGHFTPASPLASQLAALEDQSGEPGVVTFDIGRRLPAIVAEVATGLRAFLKCHPNEKETLQ